MIDKIKDFVSYWWLSVLVTIIIVGGLAILLYGPTKGEYELCHPDKEFSFGAKFISHYRPIDNTRYNCCKDEIILNDNGYYEEIEICKGFTK